MRRNKILIRSITIFLVIIFIFSLCACNANKGKSETASNAGTGGSETASTKEPPAKFTYFNFGYSHGTVPEGVDPLNNWLMDYIKKEANVEVTEWVTNDYNDRTTQFNLMMASGDIADLLLDFSVEPLKQYGYEGAFLPTENLIRNSPILSKVYDDTQIEAMKSQDGVAYIIAMKPLNDDISPLACTRQDLLQELGYSEAPKTLDGWVEAARKLKQAKPTSIPFACVGDLTYAMINFIPFNIPNNGVGWAYFPEKDKVCNVWEGDGIIKAVNFGRSIYAEGLWDKEFPTTSKPDYEEKRLRNNVLVFYNNLGGVTNFPLFFIQDEQNDARVLPIDLPVEEGMGRDAYYFAPAILGVYSFAINKKVEGNTDKINGIMRFIEVQYSKEVEEFTTYGREGIEHEVVNNVKVPLYPGAASDEFRYLKQMFGRPTVNTETKLIYNLTNNIYSSTVLNDVEKGEYLNLMTDAIKDIKSKVTGKVGYNPLNVAKPLEDELRNLASQVIEEQRSLLVRAFVGEIDVQEFTTQRDNLLKKYQNITDAYNDATDEAKVRLNLK